MGKWTKRILIALGVIAVLGGGAYYWLIMESGAASGSYTLDIAQVRRLADSMPGDKPREIHVEQVAAFAFPQTAVVAGDGWNTTPVPVFSYQLVFPNSTAIVDTALDEKIGKAAGIVKFYPAAFARMSAALNKASLIVVTHEHGDHIGGLLAQPNLKQLLNAAKLNKEQVDNLQRYAPGYPRAAFQNYHPIPKIRLSLLSRLSNESVLNKERDLHDKPSHWTTPKKL